VTKKKVEASRMSDSQTDAVLLEWRESARYWEKHSATIRTMFAPLTRALVEEAGIIRGDSVLDVAGGPGEPSLTIAEMVGPTGSVTCTDAVAEMVRAAEREAHRRGIANVTFRQCSADSLPFGNDSFDVVVSRLGAMFFPNPVAAFREMMRVTKPGGALALVVWHKSELNPFAYVVTEVMSRYVEPLPADPDAPGAFRFAEPGKLASLLADAGATDVRERMLKFHIEAPISPAEFWAMRSETSDTLREKVAKLSNEQAVRVATEVQEAVRGFFPSGQMKFPAQMIIVIGTKALGSP
jgi:SAM-dependent methyltransferase